MIFFTGVLIILLVIIGWVAFTMSVHDSAYEEMKRRIEEDE